MPANTTFLKLSMINTFLNASAQAKKELFDDLIIYATDPVNFKRRMRMISHLSLLESQALDKIRSFESADIEDFNACYLIAEIYNVIDRSS
jgi:hypothetical protein